ncbi:MAG: methylmalonyl-CoA epimerase [Gemmatimonadota bacterium]
MDKIDHIGIAVNSLAGAIPAWTALLGENPTGEEEVPAEGVRVVFFGRGPGRIELLEPTRDDSPIARHLSRRGPGVHHVCLAVSDVATALARAEAAGLELLPPGVRDGAGGRAVAFFHPRSAGGVLVEISGPGTAATRGPDRDGPERDG